MRGEDAHRKLRSATCISAERRVPTEQPLRPIRKLVDALLQEMSPCFARLLFEKRAFVDCAEAAAASAAPASVLLGA